MNANNKNRYKRFTATLSRIKRNNNNIDIKKEQYLLNRLEAKLGKPREEIQNILSKDLLSLLAIVPFNKR